MASLGPGSVVLFLSSDPAIGAERARQPRAVGSVGRGLVPPILLMKGNAAGGPARPAPDYPTDQLACAQRVLDLGRRLNRRVSIVDVNAPGEDHALVDRYVTPEDVLPVLVRADGVRLVGEESFDPRGLRRFLADA